MDSTALGIIAGLGMVSVVISLVWVVVSVIANWRIFEKAGEAGWKCLIPFYSSYVEYEFTWIGWLGIVYVVLLMVPGFLRTATAQENPSAVASALVSIAGIASFIISAIQSIRLSKAFGHGIGFGIGLILLSPIFRIILGFGNSEYVGKVDTSKLL